MYVVEHLEKAARPLFSYEIIPPRRGSSARQILDIVERLIPFKPPFIDVTSHASEIVYEENPQGQITRQVKNKRPGTISICGIIQNRYDIDTVPHILCRGFDREKTEDAMIELNFLGIHNVLAIRGDDTGYTRPPEKGRAINDHAVELVGQLNDLRLGNYLDCIDNCDPIPVCIGVGGYPEKHLEAPNLKTDLRHLKAKVDAGADYIVTQMFFDNKKYFEFVGNCRAAGIDVPIIPGLKVLYSHKQLSRIPSRFYVNVPDELGDEMEQNPPWAAEIGIRWAVKQSRELIEAGVKCIHFFVMNDVDSVAQVVERLRK